MKPQTIFYLGVLLSTWMMSCKQPDIKTYDQEANQLIQQNAMYHNRYCSLVNITDSLWDAVSLQLEKGLPDNLPPTDRKIFLSARNADHITMFKSFKTLNPKLQKAVIEAGKLDSLLANQVRDLQKDMTKFETQKLIFLKKVEKNSKDLSQILGKKINSSNAQPCK